MTRHNPAAALRDPQTAAPLPAEEGATAGQHLLDLADRCEAATGPDRELDEAIHIAIYPDHPRNKALREYHSGNRETVEEPSYTASLDAAMTLVPEGLTSSVLRYDSGRGRSGVCGPGRWNRQDAVHYSHAATPALALCAASLRARAAQ